MSSKAANSLPIQSVANVASEARSKGVALAAQTLPKAADAAQRAGEGLARMSRTAGDSAARGLRAISPSQFAQAGAALAGAQLVRSAVAFLLRRPILTAVGGAAIIGAGAALWHARHSAATDDEGATGSENPAND